MCFTAMILAALCGMMWGRVWLPNDAAYNEGITQRFREIIIAVFGLHMYNKYLSEIRYRMR